MRPEQSSLGNTQPSRGRLRPAVGWTVANAVLPGTALLKSGRRSGWAFLVFFLAVPIIAVAACFLFGGLDLILRIAVRPNALIGVALALVVFALCWALLVVAGNYLMNSLFGLGGRKRIVSMTVCVVLVAAVGVPAGFVVRALEAQRSLLLNSFITDDDASFGLGERRDTRTTPEPEDPWVGQPRLNIMLLGHDAAQDRVGTRPDTIMVASIDTRSGATSLFSIPRNLQYVEFPAGSPMHDAFPNGFDAYGPTENLINAVWTWAADHPDLFPHSGNPGLIATRQAVEQTLGLAMDRYAMVNLQGFAEVVDALGGVEIVVERRIPTDAGRFIAPGRQLLNGGDALWYARSREGSDDFDRICRQQRLVGAMIDSVDPARIAGSFVQLARAAESNISTDIRVSELDAMVELLFKVRAGGISNHPITPTVINPAAPDFDALHVWVDTAIGEDGNRPTTEAPTPPQEGDPEPTPTAGQEPTRAGDPAPLPTQNSGPGSEIAGCTP
ncbi:hypothetical protein GCM10027403_06600 [Arthrobacter tecti]